MTKPIDRLLEIMAQLRNPDGGCPWDVEQDFKSIAPCTIEEAYEVVDAIYEGNMESLREELGDLLLQVVFHAQMASEQGEFNFDDVATNINEKLVRRHPHVFSDAVINSAEAQTASWEAIKAEERAEKGGNSPSVSILDNIPSALPALTRAYKLQKRAAKVGFDWSELEPVFDSLSEEIGELQEAIAHNAPSEKLLDEMGDVLFSCVNVARKLGIDPEDALRSTNRKFTSRFKFIEKEHEISGRKVADSNVKELESLWQKAKLNTE